MMLAVRHETPNDIDIRGQILLFQGCRFDVFFSTIGKTSLETITVNSKASTIFATNRPHSMLEGNPGL